MFYFFGIFIVQLNIRKSFFLVFFFFSWYFPRIDHNLKLCLILEKFEVKCKEKIIERKGKGERK